MIHLLNVEEWAERYHTGNLSPQELKSLHQSLEQDAILNKAFDQALHLQISLRDYGKRTQLKNALQLAANSHKSAQKSIALPKRATLLQLSKKYWRPLSAAASIALFSSMFTYWVTKESSEKHSQYVQLKGDVEKIKISQKQLISNMKSGSRNANPGNLGGSGFAISPQGFVATNYHVVEDADSVYLEMNNGDYYKASIVSANPEADLAILKVDATDFSFGKSLPYTISKAPTALGQKIFTLGYPKQDLVYNEGYVSSEKGYEGDVNAYQLEIIANPGQSGSPILDNSGNVIGVLTGKQSNTTGTTFAVHTDELLSLIKETEQKHKIQLGNANRLSGNRTEQIKALKNYVCAVRVYK